MKARDGQVALYLVMVLLAIAVLMVVNVNAFLAVRSKNRMMNAVDGAALAAAKHQGFLLNEVGRLNVEHLRAAVLGEPWTDENGVNQEVRLRELTFLRPVEAIRVSNEAAADWGCAGGDSPRAAEGFADHIQEILQNPDLYPPADDVNLWHIYAEKLSAALSGNPAVLPSYMEMVNPGSSGLYANHGFYDVLAAKAWCWFSIGNHAQHLDGDPSQAEPYEITPAEVPENSEVYSLHVTFKTWTDSAWADEYIPGRGFSARWTNFVCWVTGLTPESFSERSYAASETEVWAFYDDMWRTWSTTYNPDDFPIAGTVKPEYDVAGCVASCMMLGRIQQIRRDDNAEQVSDNAILVTAEAKPLGTVEDLDGGIAPVTAYNRFIAPSRSGERIFTEAQLVLMGSVPRLPGCGMEPGWYDHVKKHAPGNPFPGCGYCKLWSEWSDPSFRASIRSWLQQNAESCRTSCSGGKCEKGGYEYAH